MRFNHLIVEIQDKIAWISINRPKKLNALNREVLEELNTLFVALNNDAAVRIIILTGSGDKAFIAGADIAEFATFDAVEGGAFAQRPTDCFRSNCRNKQTSNCCHQWICIGRRFRTCLVLSCTHCFEQC